MGNLIVPRLGSGDVVCTLHLASTVVTVGVLKKWLPGPLPSRPVVCIYSHSSSPSTVLQLQDKSSCTRLHQPKFNFCLDRFASLAFSTD